ncbi:nuclear transport factor 2 family protein [Flavobacteriaceae bacterium D16]|nr:nuclear transport factor 2 family protein [Flavobacteriaceae bacterium D16]
MKLIIEVFLISIFLFGCNNDQSKKKTDDILLIEQTSINTSEKKFDLFNKIKTLDSLFFDVAYNKCDTLMGRKLVSKDFEFYHDQGGALLNEPNELASEIMVEDLSWICNDAYRILVTNSMEVFPLYAENKLYGAIQKGNHQFYEVENKIPTELKTNAKFIHLWILEDNDWKLKRVFSFDHQKVIKN